MSETLLKLLSRLSEDDGPAILPGRLAAPHRGPAFDRLLRSGVLDELAPLQLWPSCEDCVCGTPRRIERRDGRWVAACPFDDAADELLDDLDRLGFGIDFRRLVLEASDGAATELDMPGLWRVPNGADRRPRFLTFKRRVMNDPSVPAALSTFARGSALALVGPSPSEAARRAFAGTPRFRVFPVETALVPGPDGSPTLAPDVIATDPKSVRLFVDYGSGLVLVDGIETPVSAQPLRLLRLLLSVFPGWLTAAHIEKTFSQRQGSDVARELRNALAKSQPAGHDARTWIANRPSPPGYRLTLPEDAVACVGLPD